ncbi:MAG: hypothetical protein KJ043_14840 [Anaerolineae bacterium]|nr:hypothetical protein [Anaerolineae bacterium]
MNKKIEIVMVSYATSKHGKTHFILRDTHIFRLRNISTRRMFMSLRVSQSRRSGMGIYQLCPCTAKKGLLTGGDDSHDQTTAIRGRLIFSVTRAIFHCVLLFQTNKKHDVDKTSCIKSFYADSDKLTTLQNQCYARESML